jgi:hypothetical protein
MRCLWQACLADRQSQGLFYRSVYRVPILGAGRRNIVKGYVAHKGDRWYAVIYEGLDPVTGWEIRRWHAAGTDKASAEKLARRLAREINGTADGARVGSNSP